MSNRRQCSFCPADAATHVHGESDVFPCCRNCEQAWETNPGLVSHREREELKARAALSTTEAK